MTQQGSEKGNETKAARPIRPSIRLVAILVAIGCLAALVVALLATRQAGPAPEHAGDLQITAQQDAQPANEPNSAGPRAEAVNGVNPSAAPVTPLVAPPAAQSEPTPESRQLVASLINLQLEGGMLTQEVAAGWKQNLQKLIEQGAGAVPAIREFLAKNTDYDLGKAGKDLLGYSSHRAAMFDALTQIGGPEGVAALAGVLQISADPREIALLAQDLEKLEPGQHRQEAIDAAQQTLAMANGHKLETADVAPLFEVLQKYGDGTVVPELVKAAQQWAYYGPIALAQLPDGAGIPSLIQMAQDPKASNATRDAAILSLAQVFDQSADARTTLVEQARTNGISEFAWRIMAPVLAGDQVGYLNSGFDSRQGPPQVAGLRTTSTSDNQSFFSVPSQVQPQQVDQRISLIDELLAAANGPIPREILQEAKASLANRMPQVAAGTGQ